MISNTYFIEFEALENRHGHDQESELVENLKKLKPEIKISRTFADQVIDRLPAGFAIFERGEWGLESEGLITGIYWCEHYYLNIPSINATAFIEVGDHHYYINLLINGERYFDGKNLSSSTHIPDTILDLATQFSSISDQSLN